MSSFRTPNFRDRRALVLHRVGDVTNALSRQLERLGMNVEVCWPEFPVGGEYADILFFDADNGFDGLFPWPTGAAPMPLIALLGSELPGRLEWALGQRFSAHVVKPIQSSGVFSALVIASSNFAATTELLARIEDLSVRLSARPAVVHVVVELMRSAAMGEDEAFGCIRSAAMKRRITVEAFCAGLDGSDIAELVRRNLVSSRKRLGE